MTMVELFSEKSQCCGCMACADACPKNAIAPKVDPEGFWYPEIKRELCANCGCCQTVCPLAPGESRKAPLRYLAARAKDQALRKTSTSGAVFPILAQTVLNQGGVVYGAGFDGSMQVVHQRAASRGELDFLMQTKYVQSQTAGIFRRVREDLQNGRQVLFVGTPCQAEALRRFLGREYPALIITDLICYGVPSPGVWARYTAYLEQEYHGTLTQFQFRDKRGCDNGHSVSFRIGEREYVEEEYGSDPFLALYFSNYIIRPSCHACPFTTAERGSDITLGDFWGIEKAAPGMDDGMGTSLVMLRSERGEALWESLRDQFHQIECGREDAMQPRLVSPTPPAPRRRLFFALYRRLPYGVFGWKKKLGSVLHGRKQPR